MFKYVALQVQFVLSFFLVWTQKPSEYQFRFFLEHIFVLRSECRCTDNNNDNTNQRGPGLAGPERLRVGTTILLCRVDSLLSP